jgi:hypothetical protein
MFGFGQEFDCSSCILELSGELRTVAEVIRNKPNASGPRGYTDYPSSIEKSKLRDGMTKPIRILAGRAT